MTRISALAAVLAACLGAPRLAAAMPVQPRAADQARDATLTITVADPTGAVIVGARVTLQPSDPEGPVIEGRTGERGDAVFSALRPGRYIARAEFDGFEPRQLDDVRLRAGATTRREVRLPIARLAEDVVVGQDGQDRALDPRGNAFSNVLTREQIEALPDDPDEMEETLKEMAGPGAVLRVDGFRGGKLPPKSQIRSIRFRRDMFAAENHGGGMIFVDIVTAPGAGPLRGSLDFTFRDDSLNARNAFAPRLGPEQQQNYGFTMSGTLLKDRTSFSFTSNGSNSYDSQTIVAATPDGQYSDVVRRPADRANFTARVDHALTKSHTLRATYQRNAFDNDNLGVGDFNLRSRAYSRDQNEDVVRVSVNGPIGRRLFAESRVQARKQSVASRPLLDAPAITVLDAFSAGGAQITGGREGTDFEAATDIDYANGRHAARVGFLFEGGRYRSDEMRNGGGTFTFASLEAYEAGVPTTYTQRTGNPLVSYGNVQAGWYAQDDIRMSKTMSLSLGVRQEMQSHTGDWLNLAPRVGATWSPFKSGATTFRAGAGIFYDWYDTQVYEQTLRVDGTNQVDLTIQNPGYPDPYSGGDVIVLPSGRIVQSSDRTQPTTARASLAVEQAFNALTRLNISYTYARSGSQMRGRNINAPGPDGTRPDPSAGNITQVESTARSSTHMLHTGFNMNLPWHRTFLFVNYVFANMMNDADGPASLPVNNFDPDAEWGPAPGDIRHRVSGMLNMNLWAGFKLSTTFSAGTGQPYNITTGFDDNGDTVSNDRPAGVSRNSGRTTGRRDMGARLSYTFGFGQKKAGAGGTGTPIIMVRQVGGPGDSGVGGFSGGADDKRWRFEVYVAASNIFNHTNLTGYSGVMTSPFFGQPTSAGPARKIEVGTRFSF